ncbi:Long-chain-fatty-acid--CoA ligase 3 [Araneus ventricosus]|uniref:long-chain-fatty-acid--CoA ligase n=1 Tax=Araneus ventricosus TaxID=182803 RepID=A0A4Y2AFM6_ARAVE|nr:Long-chain-fatty-acid--CoA ligase 3 [Araneus ventricosus]
MTLQGRRAKIAVYFIKFLVLIYDIISFPIYFIIDKPWNRWKLQKIVFSKLEDEQDPFSCYVRQVRSKRPTEDRKQTMDQLFRSAVEKYGDRECYGVREVLGEEMEEAKSGKKFKKMNLGEYKWLTYNEVDKMIDTISRGLWHAGVRSKKPVILLAETRLEWIVTAQACFRMNVPVVTLYTTLGADGIVHGITETEVTHIITSPEQIPELKKILPRVPTVSHLIYMGEKRPDVEDGIPNSVKTLSFSEMESSTKDSSEVSFTPPKPEDLAILMYTSGSTGIPKGVMITHKNVIITVKGFDEILSNSSFELQEKDTYIAYLPAAHILELATECLLSSLGIRVGFSSPQTLTDFSTAVKRGEKGDLKQLKPTLMVTVPLMLDRIRKSILQLAGKEGTFTRLMFDFAVSYKKFWSEKGFRTPRLDKKLLKTYRDFMGGELRIIMCGSAPLSADTQSFIRDCLNVHVLQGYGLTETSACATIMDNRKKDLVKLQFGEYVALGKVEAELKTYPLIENICVFGSGLHVYLIALVVPNQFYLKGIAKELDKENLSFEEMCTDDEITKEVADRIQDFGRKCGLRGAEIPKKVKLCTEEWNPESGLVTAAFKIRRKNIENHYKSVIDSMYAESKHNGSL